MAKNQIPLTRILTAIDRKDRDFYDNLDEEEKKAFSSFLMLRYCSSVVGDPVIQQYYLESTNQAANRNMFDLSRHKKLQWLMLTAVSPGMGIQRHQWIKQKSITKNVGAPIKKQLLALFPLVKEDDLDVLSKIITKKELNQYVRDLGES